jgi:hypothetical protein
MSTLIGEIDMLNGGSTIDLSRASKKYARAGHRHIAGWFDKIDAEIFNVVLQDQRRRGVRGNPLEIGVHHGRSFMPLCLSATVEEPAIAIDIFDNQDDNLKDPSGRGNFQVFMRNVERFADPALIRVIASSSLEVTRAQIGGPVRFASIDGAHWYEAVLSDLRLASDCAGADCVLALDDVFNPDYSEVIQAYFDWAAEDKSFSPFALSRGKLYVAKTNKVEYYKNLVTSSRLLLFNLTKTSRISDQAVPVLTGRRPGRLGWLKRYLEVQNPVLYGEVRKRFRSARGRTARASSGAAFANPLSCASVTTECLREIVDPRFMNSGSGGGGVEPGPERSH